jgi:DNA repair exonuclease SbcCD ATPase subunit
MSEEAQDRLNRRLRSVQDQAKKLQSAVRFASHRDRLEDLSTLLGVLPQRLMELRTRGYPFEKGLEEKLELVQQKWPRQLPRVRAQIDSEADRLASDMGEVEELVQQATSLSGTPSEVDAALSRAEQAGEALEAKSEAAAAAIDGMYDQIESEVSELESRLQKIASLLDRFAEASFSLLPAESPFGAVKARWDKGGKDDPLGVLYLTDQRLLFEQKQEVATKKLLFITTEKKLVQELLLEAPLGQVEEVKASRKGLLGHEDHLDLSFSSDAGVRSAHFHLDGQDCMKWQAWIGQAKAGELDKDRTVEVDQELVDRARQAPTRCPVCNGPITQRVLRGMDQIACEYCGHVVRL